MRKWSKEDLKTLRICIFLAMIAFIVAFFIPLDWFINFVLTLIIYYSIALIMYYNDIKKSDSERIFR